MTVLASVNIIFSAYDKMTLTHSSIEGYNKITIANYQYLMAIYNAKQINTTQLAKALGVTKASVTQMIDNLEAKGFIKKSKNIKDKRSLLIELSAKGNQMIYSEYIVVDHFTEKITASLNKAEFAQLEYLLDKVAKKVQNIEHRC